MNWEDPNLFKNQDSHCNVCYRPTRYPICYNCMFILKFRGGGSHQVTSKTMFLSTIEYQQTLTYKIMGYSVSKKYRVPESQRLGRNLKNSIVDKQVERLFYKLRDGYPNCKAMNRVLLEVVTMNVARRMLLYATLWHLSFNKRLHKYESESHFKGSMVTHIISCINKYYYKLHKSPSPITKRRQTLMPFAYYKHLANILQTSCIPILMSIDGYDID